MARYHHRTPMYRTITTQTLHEVHFRRCIQLIGLWVLMFASSLSAFAGNTVGLLATQPDAVQPGYTLFAPMQSTTTYLINTCGEVVHTWPSSYLPGCTAYLLKDGSIIRAGSVKSPAIMPVAFYGGVIERIAWDGTVLWTYTINSASDIQHHDICPLPNGNVLAISLDVHTKAEAETMGRLNVQSASMWSEKVVEIKPTGPTTGEVVWEWRVWDRVIQNVLPEEEHYGVIADHPERININAGLLTPGIPDWIHLNSVDYNADADQILVSSLGMNEVWIIDHSTTTAEAASHTGGHYGKGGDFLWRWGNPVLYGQGTTQDQQLGQQHSAHWIAAGLVNAGDVMVFNNNVPNGTGLGGLGYSSIDRIHPTVDDQGHYLLQDGRFGPNTASWRYISTPPDSFYAYYMSSAQRMANGNLLVCNGPAGRFSEFSPDNKEIWRYVCPVNNNDPMSQGSVPQNNYLFRIQRYATDYAAFDGRDMIGLGPIELNASQIPCTLSDVRESNAATSTLSIQLRDMLCEAGTEFLVRGAGSTPLRVELYSVDGNLVQTLFSGLPESSELSLRIPTLSHSGVYFINVQSATTACTQKILYMNCR